MTLGLSDSLSDLDPTASKRHRLSLQQRLEIPRHHLVGINGDFKDGQSAHAHM